MEQDFQHIYRNWQLSKVFVCNKLKVISDRPNNIVIRLEVRKEETSVEHKEQIIFFALFLPGLFIRLFLRPQL